jgi:hypothetical protein
MFTIFFYCRYKSAAEIALQVAALGVRSTVFDVIRTVRSTSASCSLPKTFSAVGHFFSMGSPFPGLVEAYIQHGAVHAEEDRRQ